MDGKCVYYSVLKTVSTHICMVIGKSTEAYSEQGRFRFYQQSPWLNPCLSLASYISELYPGNYLSAWGGNSYYCSRDYFIVDK
jgi:hypothetical protein